MNTLIVLCTSLTMSFGPGDPVPCKENVCKCSRHEMWGDHADSLLHEVIPITGRMAADTDVLHYDLDFTISPVTEHLEGVGTITVRSLVDNLSIMPVSLRDTFTIDAVSVDGSIATWQRIDAATIEITLDPPVIANQEFTVRVEYAGVPEPLGFGSIVFSADANGKPYVYTLSETWYAHTWWPAKDDNTDKATADLRFTVPAELTVASNGLLQSTQAVSGDRMQYHFATQYPTAAYLYAFGLGNYNTFTDSYVHANGTMPVEFYILPQSDNTSNRDAWKTCVNMLPVFAQLFGEYPFVDEKYGIYQFGFSGGMEHQTMTGQGSFGESLTAHELAHQWWGDHVTCATWNDIWLNEGFARYSEALWQEFKPGSVGAQALHDAMDVRRPTSVGNSVYVDDALNQTLGRIFSTTYTYNKGAWVLHQLRHVMGDAAFFDLLLAYRAAYADAAATTDEFAALASTYAGEDLTWFFDQWVYGIGAPAYRTSWRNVTAAGQYYVELRIRQVQDSAYPIFTMPLDVAVINAVRATETHVVRNNAEDQYFLIPVSNPASVVVLDPQDWTLHTSNLPETFQAGPPRIVDLSIQPQAGFTGEELTALTVTFHTDVTISPGDITLVGASSGTVATQFEYDPATFTLTLTPLAELAVDHYTLTIADTVTAGGLPLDGEAETAITPTAPSGDGQPGGATTIAFEIITPPIYPDVNDDGFVGTNDFFALLQAWGPCADLQDCSADVDRDGTVGLDDFFLLLQNWGSWPVD
jgi:aminopeptidase N